MKKEINIKQHDISDCGVACLASVLSYYGLKMPISKLRQIASTSKKGTNVLGLLEACEKVNLLAKAVKTDKENYQDLHDLLIKIPKPTIAHVILDNQLLHYVVIYGVKDSTILYMDPAQGEMVKTPISEFIKIWTRILILVAPEDSFEMGSEKVSIYKRFWYLLSPHKKILLQALVGSLLYTVLGLATSIYLQKIVDYVLPDANVNLLNLLSVIMVFILFTSVFVNYVKSTLMLRTGLQIDARLILGYYKHLLRLPQSFFDNMRSGEIISRINDAVKIRSFINDTLVSLTVNVFTVFFAFFLMFTYYWKLAIVILLVIPLYSLIYYIFNKLNKVQLRKLMEDAADLQAQLVESINTVGTIKKFGLEEYSDNKTENRFIKFIRTGYKSSITSLFASSSSESVNRLFTIILLWLGSYFVLRNQITAGELLSFYALIGYFINPMTSLVNVNRTFQDAKIAADRLFEIMDLDQESLKDSVSIKNITSGNIEFNNVTFRYGSRENVFEDFNIVFEKGKISAIVGESGSGKSTIAALIQNLYPLKSGQILINDVNINNIDISALRNLIGVVPQKIDLFEGTIMENIILDDFDADHAKVIEICKQIGILEFIEKLPNGFSTNIGENGVQLSGGQRQRLAIARVLYKNPEILIMDEATSALDSESELYIKKVIKDLKNSNKTILLIAHRLGTIMYSDKIYVLKEGKLIEEGTHSELLNNDSYYKIYWQNQTNYYS